MLTLVRKLIIKILNIKLAILLKYQNIKTFLQNVSFQIGLKKFFVIKKVESTVAWTYAINDLNGEETVGTFYEIILQKTYQKEFRIDSNQKKR